MANYLLVHGAWHGAWCWAAVAAFLERKGHTVAIPTLPGLNAATQAYAGSFGLADHISAVSTAIDQIPGRLILVAHSYAGMIARALESLRRDRLCHVVYLEAVVPEPGRSLLEMQPAGAAETLGALTRETPHGAVLAPPNVAQRFAITDAQLAAKIQAQLMPQPLRTLTDPLPTPATMGDEDLRRTYVFASDRFPNPYQKFIDNCTLNNNWQVIGISGGHEMMLTNAAQLAEILATFAAISNHQPEIGASSLP
jgi:pimeloyl-ACP methyl ester carboxylesterase